MMYAAGTGSPVQPEQLSVISSSQLTTALKSCPVRPFGPDERCYMAEPFRSCTLPLLGLDQLVEIPCSDPKFEPGYYCRLCAGKGAAHLTITHLTSLTHIKAFLQFYERNNPSKTAWILQNAGSEEEAAVLIESEEGRKEVGLVLTKSVKHMWLSTRNKTKHSNVEPFQMSGESIPQAPGSTPGKGNANIASHLKSSPTNVSSPQKAANPGVKPLFGASGPVLPWASGSKSQPATSSVGPGPGPGSSLGPGTTGPGAGPSSTISQTFLTSKFSSTFSPEKPGMSLFEAKLQELMAKKAATPTKIPANNPPEVNAIASTSAFEAALENYKRTLMQSSAVPGVSSVPNANASPQRPVKIPPPPTTKNPAFQVQEQKPAAMVCPIGGTGNCYMYQPFERCADPLVGLEQLVEIPCDDPDCEPGYFCTMCDIVQPSHEIVSHVLAEEHRRVYLAFRKCQDPVLFETTDNDVTTAQWAELLEAKEGRKKVELMFSDTISRDKIQARRKFFSGYADPPYSLPLKIAQARTRKAPAEPTSATPAQLRSQKVASAEQTVVTPPKKGAGIVKRPGIEIDKKALTPSLATKATFLNPNPRGIPKSMRQQQLAAVPLPDDESSGGTITIDDDEETVLSSADSGTANAQNASSATGKPNSPVKPQNITAQRLVTKLKTAVANPLGLDRECYMHKPFALCCEPLIGLEILIEVPSADDQKFEPAYFCTVCECASSAWEVVEHLLDENHQTAYLKYRCEQDKPLFDMVVACANPLEAAVKLEQREGRRRVEFLSTATIPTNASVNRVKNADGFASASYGLQQGKRKIAHWPENAPRPNAPAAMPPQPIPTLQNFSGPPPTGPGPLYPPGHPGFQPGPPMGAPPFASGPPVAGPPPFGGPQIIMGPGPSFHGGPMGPPPFGGGPPPMMGSGGPPMMGPGPSMMGPGGPQMMGPGPPFGGPPRQHWFGPHGPPPPGPFQAGPPRMFGPPRTQAPFLPHMFSPPPNVNLPPPGVSPTGGRDLKDAWNEYFSNRLLGLPVPRPGLPVSHRSLSPSSSGSSGSRHRYRRSRSRSRTPRRHRSRSRSRTTTPQPSSRKFHSRSAARSTNSRSVTPQQSSRKYPSSALNSAFKLTAKTSSSRGSSEASSSRASRHHAASAKRGHVTGRHDDRDEKRTRRSRSPSASHSSKKRTEEKRREAENKKGKDGAKKEKFRDSSKAVSSKGSSSSAIDKWYEQQVSAHASGRFDGGPSAQLLRDSGIIDLDTVELSKIPVQDLLMPSLPQPEPESAQDAATLAALYDYMLKTRGGAPQFGQSLEPNLMAPGGGPVAWGPGAGPSTSASFAEPGPGPSSGQEDPEAAGSNIGLLLQLLMEEKERVDRQNRLIALLREHLPGGQQNG